MLRVLIASQPVRAGWLGGSAVSTVTHGALIAFAVVSTSQAFSTVREERATAEERITYVEPALIAEALRQAKAQREAIEAARTPPAEEPTPLDMAAMQSALAASVQMPDLTAAPDLTAVTDAWLGQPDALSQPAASVVALLMAKSGFVAPANGVYTEDIVERSVMPKRGNPMPRYPSQLQSMGIEGDFVVRFVVDSTGIVPGDRIEFPSSMHRLFVDAVRTALLKSRYSPAKFAGHVVPQQVVQEFRFSMDRRR